ncbi:MAG: hypothetical protein AAFV77_11570, partial [Planctomycetota bacterium]
MTTTGTTATDMLHHAREIAASAASLGAGAAPGDALAAVLSTSEGVALVTGSLDETAIEALREACDDRQWQVFVAVGDTQTAKSIAETLRRSVVVESTAGALMRTLPVKPCV